MTYMKGTSLMHNACLCIKLYSSLSVLAGLGIESKFRPEDASKLKSGMKSACTIRNRERWRVDGKEEGWLIERGGDLR